MEHFTFNTVLNIEKIYCVEQHSSYEDFYNSKKIKLEVSINTSINAHLQQNNNTEIKKEYLSIANLESPHTTTKKLVNLNAVCKEHHKITLPNDKKMTKLLLVDIDSNSAIECIIWDHNSIFNNNSQYFFDEIIFNKTTYSSSLIFCKFTRFKETRKDVNVISYDKIQNLSLSSIMYSTVDSLTQYNEGWILARILNNK